MHTVHVYITNRTARLASDYSYAKLIPFWSFSVANYYMILKARPHLRRCKHCGQNPGARHTDDHAYEAVWDGKIKLFKRGQLPAGLFWATYKEIAKTGIRFKIHKVFNRPHLRKEKYWLKSEGKYDFQNTCTDKIVKAIRKGKGGLILNATGSGKTRISAMVASRLDCEFLFVVDQLNLLEQARTDIAKHLGEKIGKVGESKFKLKRFTVATRQTLNIHRKDPEFLRWFKRVDVIFIDELHEMMSKPNFDIMDTADPMSVIGLTATLSLSQKPVRLKAYSMCGPIIFSYPVLQGMQEGVLSRGIIISILYNNHIQNIRAYKAEEAYVEYIVRNSERNWLIAEIIEEANRLGKYTIVLVERLKHLEKLSRRLVDKGIVHKIVSGTFKGKDISVNTRLKSQKKFEAGKIRVILANKVFKKGVDIKRVDCIINAAGRKSKEDAIQIFGRGIRTHSDKAGLEYFDISDQDDSKSSKKNWFAKASRRRTRAYRESGLTVKRFIWNENPMELFQRADKWLKKEIKKVKEIKEIKEIK